MAVNFVSALGAGSGIDTKKLAEELVAIERAPRQAQIDKRTAAAESRISGYGVVRFALSELKNAFAGLNDLSEFASVTARSSQASAVGVSAGATAATGSLDVTVKAVATAQRITSAGYAESTTPLNRGAAFSLELTDAGGKTQSIAIAAADTSPAGIVRTINADSSLGISAQLINVGGKSPYQVVITGQTGAENAFRLSSSASDLAFDTTLQSAGDAEMTVNGLTVTRASNTITDLVEGVTLDLYTPTTGSARLDLNRDTSTVRDKINTLVTAYKDFEEALKVMSDRGSDVPDIGGVLAGDLLVQKLRSEARRLLTGDSNTPGGSVKAVRDLGLSIDRDGILQVDEARLASALRNQFDDVAQMFTGNTEGQTVYSTRALGLAGEAVKRLDGLLRTSGDLDRQTQLAATEINQQKVELQKLEARMTLALERYTRQFTVMESIVGSSNSMRTGLESTYEGLMAMYTQR
jgi:flagellar hook-associated protein 2